MKKMLWIGLGIVLVVVIAGVAMFLKGTDISQYEPLVNPRIVAKPDSRVLEVPFDVPSDGLKSVFGVLMKTYFGLPGVKKGPGMPALAARYENLVDMSLPPEQLQEAYKNIVWKGTAAIAVPETVKTLPDGSAAGQMTPRLAVWKYGEVAEILHKGPYEDETPTVRRLMEHIETQGYEIAGLHEEEYLRGPGIPFVQPKDYYTIIRYPVKKSK